MKRRDQAVRAMARLSHPMRMSWCPATPEDRVGRGDISSVAVARIVSKMYLLRNTGRRRRGRCCFYLSWGPISHGARDLADTDELGLSTKDAEQTAPGTAFRTKPRFCR